jgi:hypothetical protein
LFVQVRIAAVNVDYRLLGQFGDDRCNHLISVGRVRVGLQLDRLQPIDQQLVFHLRMNAQ